MYMSICNSSYVCIYHAKAPLMLGAWPSKYGSYLKINVHIKESAAMIPNIRMELRHSILNA